MLKRETVSGDVILEYREAYLNGNLTVHTSLSNVLKTQLRNKL